MFNFAPNIKQIIMKIYRAVVFHFILLFAIHVSAQERLRIRHGCQWDSPVSKNEIYTFEPTDEALKIVELIMSTTGLKSNFIIKAANVANAIANTEKDKRYILYSTVFLENFKKDSKTDWAAYCVLAHEIGHHLNYDDFKSKNWNKRKEMELAADVFAGNCLQKLGATLEETKAGINTFPLPNETETHPSKSARLEAIVSGWRQADDQVFKNKGSDIYIGTKSFPYREKEAENFYEKGVNAFNEKKYIKSISYYDEAIKYNPEYSDAYNNKCAALIKLNLFKEALINADSAIQIKPTNAEAFANRAVIKEESKDYDKALEDVNKAISLNPKLYFAYYVRGTIKMNLKQISESIKDFEQAILINPNGSGAYNSRGNCKLILRQFDDAMIDYNKAIELDSSNVLYLSNRGACKSELKLYKDALIDLERAMKLDSNVSSVYCNRGKVFKELLRLDEALEDFNKAIKLKPKEALHYSNQSLLRVQLKQFDMAIEDANYAISLDPNFADAYFSRGSAKNQMKRFNEAIIDYNQAIILYQKDSIFQSNFSNAYCNRGSAKLSTGFIEDALQDFNQAIIINSKNALAYFNKGFTLAYFGQYQAAIDCLNEAERLDETMKTTELVQKLKQELLKKFKD